MRMTLASKEKVATHQTLTPAAVQILISLAPRERHGYGIMQEVERLSDGKTRLGAGTLYRTLRNLKEGGLIEEVEDRVDPELDDERRRYYRLTNAGRHAMSDEVRHMARLVAQAKAAEKDAAWQLAPT
jgi:DNA-binding PadR family transcriptional regulator